MAGVFLALIGGASTAAAGLVPTHQPTSVPYGTLVNPSADASELRSALRDVGLVQITGIPGFETLRQKVLDGAATCDTWKQTHTFEDGTERKTIASRSIPNGPQPFDLPTGAACDKFAHDLVPFRALVADATAAFSKKLTELVGNSVATPLLATQDDHPFTTFADVVEAGEHLEHVHRYARRVPAASNEEAEALTLDMHTDQGLFIAFTPALTLAGGVPVPAADAADFFVGLADGSRARVAFADDALVFMLGQGVEALLRPAAGAPKPTAPRFLPRATPHALLVKPNAARTRLWYGRMVLPPQDALAATGETYAQQRAAMYAHATEAAASPSKHAGAHAAFGCDGRGATKDVHARKLQHGAPATCAEGFMYCWQYARMHRTRERTHGP